MAATARKNIEKITLTVGLEKFNFTVGREDYNRYVNTMTMTNKVQPNHNLLMTTVDADSHDALNKFLESTPGSEINLGSELTRIYAPDLDIVVKKSSSEQST